MSASTRLTVRLPQELSTQLDAYCQAHDFTAAFLLRQGLAHVLAQDPITLRPKPRPTPKTRPTPPSTRGLILQVLREAGEPLDVLALRRRLPPKPQGRRKWPREWYREEVDSACRALKRQGRVVRVASCTYALPAGTSDAARREVG